MKSIRRVRPWSDSRMDPFEKAINGSNPGNNIHKLVLVSVQCGAGAGDCLLISLIDCDL